MDLSESRGNDDEKYNHGSIDMIDKKVEVKLRESDVKLAEDLHKDIMIRIAIAVDNIKNGEEKFHFITFIMVMIISNILDNLNIKDEVGVNSYLDALSGLVKQLRKLEKENLTNGNLV